MRYILEDTTLDFKFTTRQFSTGAPFTLAGTPSMAVYQEGSLTQITGASITLTVDYDGKTGLNDVSIDLSASASYTADNAYQVVVEAGTVDSVSVVGEVVYEFFIVAAGGMEDLITRGLLALPNAASNAAGGLPISDAGGLDLDAKLAETNEVTAARMGALTDWIDAGRLDTILDAIAADVVNLDGAAMRGTDNAALASAYTAARAGYLDNLNIGENVAGTSEVTSIQNNTRVVRVVPQVVETPDAGTADYRIELLLYDSVGNMEAPDSAPTLELVNQDGTDLSSRLDATTGTLVSTGRYRWVYTSTAGDTLEQLLWTFTVIEGGATRLYGNQTLLVDTTAVDFTAADRTKLNTLHDTRLTAARAGYLDALNGHVAQTGDSYARLGAPVGASISADVAAVQTDVTTLLGRITSTLFTGITSLAEWIGALAGKQAPDATAQTELRASGAGSGSYDATTDSLEAIRDTAPLGTAMRGTDNAALASVATEARLAELDAGNLPTDIASVQIDTTAILADTNEMQGDLANGGRLDLILDAILLDTGTDGVAIAAATMDSIASTLLDLTDGVESSTTVREALRVILAACAGKSDGLATTTANYRDRADTKNRISATVDADGNRTAVTLDVT